MDRICIIIPTCKEKRQLKNLLKELNSSIDNSRFRVITTCFKSSAATNRNYGLIQADSNMIIMIDDDISGFFQGWSGRLIEPLYNSSVVMVSARLIDKNGNPGVMMNIRPDLSRSIVEVKEKMLPSACIAFRKDDLRFDESYAGAGFEDTDFCMQLNQKYPNGKYLIHNEVKLIHFNEMKNQRNGQLQINEQYFHQKWRHLLCA